jgi:hypothetical protein
MAALERTTRGFTFQSDLSLAQMKQILEAGGKQMWVSGDSEWHGDYLGGSLSPEAVARIYPVKIPGRFHVSLRFVIEAGDPNCNAKLLQAEWILLKQVLPAIEGRDAQPAEPLE